MEKSASPPPIKRHQKKSNRRHPTPCQQAGRHAHLHRTLPRVTSLPTQLGPEPHSPPTRQHSRNRGRLVLVRGHWLLVRLAVRVTPHVALLVDAGAAQLTVDHLQDEAEPVAVEEEQDAQAEAKAEQLRKVDVRIDGPAVEISVLQDVSKRLKAQRVQNAW
eukprot:TRINITY_DN2354_c0_g1_i4.p2 TRINITY_DN2354_c0_g1~~TRINITY_DN2354_c0_g1_i4.p2  ORF type:complete len:161 (+),score=2.60 TRINITY_DN2354_c0_g1_i4:261-743(+)